MTLKILLLLDVIIVSHAYTILGLFPHPAISHVNVFFPLMRGLALKGHQVTFVSHFNFPETPNMKQLLIEKSEESLVGAVDMSYLPGGRIPMYLNNVFLAYLGVKACENLGTPVMQKLIDSDEHFDVVIMEFFNTDCYAPFAHKFNAHLVGLSSCTMMQWTNERFANIYNPAFVPTPHLDYSDRMTFFERVENTLMVGIHEVLYNHLLRWNDDRIARSYFKHEFPPLTDIVRNASLFLVNTHFSLNLPRPLVPQVVDVGGIHVGQTKKLPQSYGDGGSVRSRIMSFAPLILLSSLLLAVHSYKILALFPHPGRSHADVFLPLTKALAKKGHEVTVVSYFPLKTPLENYKDVRLGDNTTQVGDIFPIPQKPPSRTEFWFSTTHMLIDFAFLSCKMGLESPEFQNFLRTDQTFDIIIAEFFNSDCFLGVLHKFKAPLIGISSCTIMHWTNERFANPTHPAYIPENLMDHSDKMTFLERTENLLIGLWRQSIFDTVINWNDEVFIKKYFGEDVPPLREIVFNSSLFLVNTHFSLNLPRPLVPGVVEVGGIHLGEVKKLPKNLEKWINESTHGVIYFSLGSMIKGHTLPDEKRQEFLKAFGRLPQRVLWKWENETLPGKPDNVMIQKWMPQLDILCHPNVKAFISHGGLLGTTEAVHCGVPVLVMPQYGDQFTNAKALEANGGGVILHLHEATEERLYESLRIILDPKFKKQAEDLSARFKDRPLPPLETAIYWVEYVARHGGAHHMRTAAVGMPLYKYLLLDVIAFLLLVFAVISALFFYIARTVFRRLFCRKDKKKQKTN